MKRVMFNIFIAVFIVVWIGASATACTTSPVANIISPDPNYVGVLGPWVSLVYGKVIVDGSGSSDADGTIVKYEWDYDWDGIAAHFHADYWETTSYHFDGNFDGRHCGACYAEPGQYTLGLRVTDNDNLTDTATCTIYAVQLEVDVPTPTNYPQWVNVDDTFNVGCTVTPSGLGGSYSWSRVIGAGTLTFSPSASVEDPTVSKDTRGAYRVKVEYTVDWVTLLDITGDIYVPDVQLFRNSNCDERLDDWPAEGRDEGFWFLAGLGSGGKRISLCGPGPRLRLFARRYLV